jgi:hypothetical protein
MTICSRLLKCAPDIRIPYIQNAQLLQNEKQFLFELPGKKGRAYAKAINELYGVMKP